jgi:hypothetical protein
MKGLVTHYLLFVINLADRVVDIVGITTRPDETWMLQAGRNLIDSESGAMRGKGYLILDRDTKYTDQFRRLIRSSGANVIRLPPRSPNLNAYAERFVRSIKSECLNRMIFIGQASLRRAVAEYVDHYHGERNHQGLDNRLIRPVPSSVQKVGTVRRNQRLVGCSTSTIAKRRDVVARVFGQNGMRSSRMEQTVPSPLVRARLHGAGELRHTANSLPTGTDVARDDALCGLDRNRALTSAAWHSARPSFFGDIHAFDSHRRRRQPVPRGSRHRHANAVRP